MAHVNLPLATNYLLGCSCSTNRQNNDYKKNWWGGVVIGYSNGKDENKHFSNDKHLVFQ